MTSPPESSRWARPPRWALAIVLSILTIVGAVGSVVGYWAHNVLLDTDTWVETVGPIGTAPVVTDALADYTAEQLNEFLDPTGRLSNLLPGALSPLAEVAGGAIENAIEEETAGFFESSLYDDLWIGLNRTAHTAVVAIVRDEIPFLSTEGGVVSVDLVPIVSPIVDRVIVRIQRIGASVPEFILNRTEFDDALAQLINDYESEGLPEHLSAIVVWESDRLAAVQETVALFDRLVLVLPVLTAVIAAGAIVVAPRRPRMIAILLLGAAGAWWVSMLLTDLVVANVLSDITSENAADVAEALLETITAGLDDLLTILLIVGGLAGLASLAAVRNRKSVS